MTLASKVERLMLDLINDARADAGLDPLVLALDLNTSAEDHSSWMLRTDTFSHTGAGGSSAGDRMEDAGFVFSGSWSWGENIAWQSERGSTGIADDVRNLFTSLMNSAGHRANILSASYNYVGIGVERGDFGGWDAVMVTQNFASTGGAVARDTGAATSSVNAAPVVEMADITVSGETWKGRKAKVEKYLDASDPDGDEIVYYEVRDQQGRHNFKLKGDGVINARDGYVIDADELSRLVVRRDGALGDSRLEIRASDGDDWSDWAAFTLHTVSADDYFA
ncbi:MAG: CAP domain-containing protein [Paracoccaceae bacterium]